MIKRKLTIEEKIDLFYSLFQGITEVYGTYDPETGKYWQVKEQVTHSTIYNHLKGTRSYGFYPLKGELTQVGVVDFDVNNTEPAIHFIDRAKHYEIHSYLERSKFKGYHVWLFFSSEGVPAREVRLVIHHILSEIEYPETEVFPKQDSILQSNSYGNFINAPLFGRIVPQGKTIFIEPDNLNPIPDQWDLLTSIKRIERKIIKSIIDINDLNNHASPNQKSNVITSKGAGYGLPVCIRRILNEGVSFNQRIACFRIAVHLRRIGLPYDAVLATLMDWRQKNLPQEGKRIITQKEIKEQTQWACKKDYTGYGCTEPIVMSFCDERCPVFKNS